MGRVRVRVRAVDLPGVEAVGQVDLVRVRARARARARVRVGVRVGVRVRVRVRRSGLGRPRVSRESCPGSYGWRSPTRA